MIKQFYLCAYMLQGLLVCLNGQTNATAYSPPLGGIELHAGAFRETPVGVPLHRSAVVIAYLAEVASPVLDQQNNFVSLRLIFDRTIGIAGDYNPNPNTGLPAYYLEFVTGAASGERFSIAGSGEDWIIIEQLPQGALLASFDPSELRDRVRIRPCWTPETFMPSAEAPLSVQSDTSSQIEMRDEDAILLFGSESNVQHVIHRFYNSEDMAYYWAEWGSANNPLIANDYGMLPGQASWIRRSSGIDVKWTVTGDVTTFTPTWAVPLPIYGEVTEWSFSLTEPTAMTLDSSGLKSVLRASTSSAERADELIVWNDDAGFYSRVTRQFYLQSASPEPIWREIGDTVTDQGTYELEPGKAYTIRRRGE